MLIAYAKISKSDGSQTLDLQTDALLEAGVSPENIYCDKASGKKDLVQVLRDYGKRVLEK